MASSNPSPIPLKSEHQPAKVIPPPPVGNNRSDQFCAKVGAGKSSPLTSACSGHPWCSGPVQVEGREKIKSLRAGRLARPADAQFDAPRRYRLRQHSRRWWRLGVLSDGARRILECAFQSGAKGVRAR